MADGDHVFRSARYRECAPHLARMPKVAFNRTDVDDVIDLANKGRAKGNEYPLLEGRIGDPTKYGLGAYPGYHRHLQRYVNFHASSDFESYDWRGDPNLVNRLRMGWTRSPGYQEVPDHVEVYITPGVAGALRLISDALLLPPPQKVWDKAYLDDLIRICQTPHDRLTKSDTDKLKQYFRESQEYFDDLRTFRTADNAVMPLWTYVSHLAETFRSHGDVKLCPITADGQIDVGALEAVITPNTRSILFSTVGNPLSVAMTPEVFDEVLRVTRKKMDDYGHPIVVLADIIYEHFRRAGASRIDPLQRVLRLDIGVPVVEMSSFSKMMAMPGLRMGHCRILWDPASFPDERQDFLDSVKYLYLPTLGQVSTHVQRALGSLYSSINQKRAVEEELAPIAAVLCALRELEKTKKWEDGPLVGGEGQVILPMPQAVPNGYFTSKTIASMTRKLAHTVLARYGVDMTSGKVREIMAQLQEPGFIGVIQHESLSLYKLNENVQVRSGDQLLDITIPQLEKDEDGQLDLYGIAGRRGWSDIAKLCGVYSEDLLYVRRKESMRKIVFERVEYFARELDRMRSSGVYLHPAYYGRDGKLDPNKLNAYYVLWGFDALREPSDISQAARFARRCVELGEPIVANIPAEVFLPPEARGGQGSFMRHVALQTKDVMDKILDVISTVARDLRSSLRPSIPP